MARRAPKPQQGDNFVNDVAKANRIKFCPRNRRQSEYAIAIRDNAMTFATGPAGTSKSYTAVTVACDMLLRGKVDKFIVARPAVAACDENHGFLPGDLRKKLAPWARPIVDIMKKHGVDAEKMAQDGKFEAVPFTFLRGLTFDNAFIMLDEAQNTTPEQMRLFLTRLGENVRVVVDGDIAQKDIRGDSGLADGIDLFQTASIPHGVVEFLPEDVERSALCRQIVLAYHDRDARKAA